MPTVAVPRSALAAGSNAMGSWPGLTVAGTVESFVATGILRASPQMYTLPVYRQGDYLWFPYLLALETNPGVNRPDLVLNGLFYTAYYDFLYAPAQGAGAPPPAPIVGGAPPPPAPVAGSAPPPPPPAPVAGGVGTPVPAAPPAGAGAPVDQTAPFRFDTWLRGGRKLG